MLTMENVTALRMRRHCLTRRAGAAEYDALYRDLSPGLNVHTGTGSGSRRAWWSARILTTWNTTAGASGSAFW